jgi:hypothetical protein
MPASEARAVGHAEAGKEKRFGRLNRFNKRNMQLYDAAVNNKFFAGFARSFHSPFSPMHPFSAYEIVSLRLKQLNIRPKQHGPHSLRWCDGVAQTGHLFSCPRMTRFQELASSNVDANALFELI